MAHYETYYDHSPVVRSGGSNAAGFPAVTMFDNVFDASRRNLVAEDTVDVLDIPAGSRVMNVFIEVVHGETGVTIDVGDGDGGTIYFDAESVATTGTRAEADGASATGKFYPTGGTLRIGIPTGGTAMETGRVRVVAAVAAMG